MAEATLVLELKTVVVAEKVTLGQKSGRSRKNFS